MVEIMIVVAIIGILLAVIALPSFMRVRSISQKNLCINNLRQIESAKEQYAVESGHQTGWSFSDGMEAFSNLVGKANGYIKGCPACPASVNANVQGTVQRSAADYIVNAIGSMPSCRVVRSGSDAHVL